MFAGVALRFGDVKSLNDLGDIPAMTTSMLMRGTSKHTRQQIQDEFDRLKARVNINTWGSGLYAGVETTRENLPAALALLGEVLVAFTLEALQLRPRELLGARNSH